MIHLHLTTHPRAGTITIRGERFDLATWHRAGEGQMHATTDNGHEVTFTSDGHGGGAISFAGRHWTLRGLAWNGTTMTGEAREGVSDAAMAEMFGVEMW